jgi:hypothetical protein
MQRLITIIGALGVLAALIGGPRLAEACAGLVGPNGAVNLGRTTTLAGYNGGIEHYVTSFQFEGGGGEFGALIPLPGVPSKVERGGAWTLQRLERETEPPTKSLVLESADYAATAEVLQQVRIDALDITVLKGGGAGVATWAKEHGFRLSPDAPEVLDFYARRSPIFLAAVFDSEAAQARGQQVGDGTPVHITIPTTNPWVPLRILALGKKPSDRVDADVYLLTDERPTLLPGPRDGLARSYDRAAAPLLLNDLRGDAGMGWVPQSAWLTKLQLDSAASDVRFDLAVDTTSARRPSPVAAGFALPGAALPAPRGDDDGVRLMVWLGAAAGALVLAAFVMRARAAKAGLR